MRAGPFTVNGYGILTKIICCVNSAQENAHSFLNFERDSIWISVSAIETHLIWCYLKRFMTVSGRREHATAWYYAKNALDWMDFAVVGQFC